MSTQTNMIGRPVGDLDTPVLLVNLDKLERNIAKLRQVIIAEAGIGWRPHTKAIKTPAIAHKLLQAGAHGVTCAKLSEAEVMAAAGIRDILISNQVVGNAKITRLVPSPAARRHHRGRGLRCSREGPRCRRPGGEDAAPSGGRGEHSHEPRRRRAGGTGCYPGQTGGVLSGPAFRRTHGMGRGSARRNPRAR